MNRETALVGLRWPKPYPTYKDSGVDWLGKIPAHWEARPLKYVAPLTKDRKNRIVLEIPYIGLEQIESRTGKMVRAAECGPSEEQAAEGPDTRFRSGDVLFGKLRPYLAKVFLSSFDGRCSSEFLVLRSGGEISPALLAYQLLSSGFIAWINAMTYGTKMPRASPDQVMSTPIAIPDADEQSAISAFLDRVTSKIDALIEKKERLIELLQEKRTALITQAVTKGLDPTVRMKDSGVEWLGKIPAHWEVKRLRHIGAAIIGLTYEPADVVDPDNGVLVLRASNVRDGHIVLEDNVFVKRSIPACLETKEGDILICARSGSRALIGKSAMIDKTYAGLTFGTFMLVFRSVCNDYLFYTFNSTLFNYQSGAFLTSTINQLTLSNLNNFTVPAPPKNERAAIVAFLENETAKIDSLVANIHAVNNRLKEYRTALISAAVTGKIDVREAKISAAGPY